MYATVITEAETDKRIFEIVSIAPRKIVHRGGTFSPPVNVALIDHQL